LKKIQSFLRAKLSSNRQRSMMAVVFDTARNDARMKKVVNNLEGEGANSTDNDSNMQESKNMLIYAREEMSNLRSKNTDLESKVASVSDQYSNLQRNYMTKVTTCKAMKLEMKYSQENIKVLKISRFNQKAAYAAKAKEWDETTRDLKNKIAEFQLEKIVVNKKLEEDMVRLKKEMSLLKEQSEKELARIKKENLLREARQQRSISNLKQQLEEDEEEDDKSFQHLLGVINDKSSNTVKEGCEVNSSLSRKSEYSKLDDGANDGVQSNIVNNSRKNEFDLNDEGQNVRDADEKECLDPTCVINRVRHLFSVSNDKNSNILGTDLDSDSSLNKRTEYSKLRQPYDDRQNTPDADGKECIQLTWATNSFRHLLSVVNECFSNISEARKTEYSKIDDLQVVH